MPTTSHMPTFHRDQPLSDLSRAIIQYVAENPGAGTTAIKHQVGQNYPGHWPGSRCHNLAKNGHLVNANQGSAGRNAAWYTADAWAAMQAAQARKHPTTLDNWLAMPTKRTAPDLSPWRPPQHQPAREGALVAFGQDCPSRSGDKFTPYTGPKPYCVGTGLGIYGPGRAGSSARGVV